jgi:integrase
MGKKITKKIVDAITPDPTKDVFVWDSELRGFGVRAKPSGVKTFLIQYRNARAQTRRYAIGQFGRLTVDQARAEAKIRLADVEMGRDPSADRRSNREALTVASLCAAYFEDAEKGRVLRRGKPKKQSTLAIDKGRIIRHICPLIGDKAVDELTRHDVTRFMHDVIDGKSAIDEPTGLRGRARVTGGPGTAAKAVNLLSAIYTYAIDKGLVGENPCRGIERPSDQKRKRYLTSDEYQRIGRAITEAEDSGINRMALDAIRALMLTGCRKSEILTLKHGDIDVAGRCLRLGDTKTGAQLRPCGNTALEFLTNITRTDSEYVFPASRGDGPLVGMTKPLAKICEMAKLDGITAHIFRHSFATTAHELDYSELTIAGLLGHNAGSVTARYAHHVDHALAAAADRVSATIASRMNGQESDEEVVVNLRPGGFG